jgi:hypothetical protein
MGIPGKGGRPLRVEDTVLTYDVSCGWGYICPNCTMYVDNPEWRGNKGVNLALISYRMHKEMCK